MAADFTASELWDKEVLGSDGQPLGRVVAVATGRDGKVRKVAVAGRAPTALRFLVLDGAHIDGLHLYVAVAPSELV